MPINNFCVRLLVFSLLILLQTRSVGQNYVFAQLNGSPMNTSGWNLQGAAKVANVTGSGDSEMLICPAVLNSSGAVFYNQPINLSLCNKWVAEFDFRTFDGTGADGLAFCFLDVPPSGFVTGGGLGIPNSANGLKVCFDTYNNCGGATIHQDMPKIEIRWGIGYSNNSNVYGECNNQPTRDNADGSLSFMYSTNYNHAKITYDSGNIQVFVNDTLYLSGYQQFNFAGYLGFTASTGGNTDNHSIKNVIIYTEMPPSIAGSSQSFCPYDTVQLGSLNNPAYAYSWYPSVGLNDTASASPLLHLKNDSSDSQWHIYYVRTSFKDKIGCASVDSVAVRVYPNPKVNFVMPQICLTDAFAQFYDSSYTSDNSTLPFSYQWNFGDPNASFANPNNSSLQNPAHHYSAARHYPMSLTVTNAMGCTDSASKIFTVNGAVPKADFSVNTPTELCSGRTVSVVNQSTVDFGSITRIQLFWGDTVTQSYTDSTPFSGKIYTHYYPNPITAAQANYTIRMISSSGISCGNEMDQQITILPSPHLQFDSLHGVCTYDSAFQITQVVELANVPGTITYFGKGVSAAGIFTPSLAGIGKDSLLAVFTGTNGCLDSAYQTIALQPPPKVFAGNDTSVVINQPLQLLAVADDPINDRYSWSPPTDLSNMNIANPIAVLGASIDTIIYSVKATDTLGCYGTASLKVTVFKTLPDIFVPNAFTPGKASNNIFRPIPIGISSLLFFRVYNREGQLVYSTSQMGHGWDGTIAGKLQDEGTYVWMVQGTDYAGKTIFKKGAMVLIR